MARSPLVSRADAVVIGAGIIGASTAYFLARRGYSVALIERAEVCSGATRHSAAHVRQHYSNEVAIRLVLRALAMFQDDAAELGGPTGFTRTGYLLLAGGGDEPGLLSNLELQQRLGVRTSSLTPAEVASRWPEVDLTGVTLAAYEPESGYADPVRTVQTLVAATRAHGGHAYEHTPVVAIDSRRGAVRSVLTARGEITTPVVVNAAGPWANRIAAMAGGSYSLRLSREEEAVFRLPLSTERLPIVSDAPGHLYFRPAGADELLAGFGYPKELQPCDPDDFSERADDGSVAWLADAVSRRLPGAAASLANGNHPAATTGRYAGVYSITDDWYPIVGGSEWLDGMYEAVGGSGHCFKLGPPIGEALAALISGETPAIDISSLHGSRFRTQATFQSVWGAGNRA
jgi:sarcosine oxidase, subunit beta